MVSGLDRHFVVFSKSGQPWLSRGRAGLALCSCLFLWPRGLFLKTLCGRAEALPFRKMSHFVRWSFAFAKLVLGKLMQLWFPDAS